MNPAEVFWWSLGISLAAVVVARVITTSVRYSTTKQCPTCKERVKSGATKCRFCGMAFEIKSGPSPEERAGM